METISLNPVFLSMSNPNGNDDNNDSDNHYVPGACNMGKDEIRRRKIAGWSGLILTGFTIAFLLWSNSPQWMRLVIFIPAVMSATGFIQAYSKFCVYFGFGHMFNFGKVGETDTIVTAASRIKDRKRAWELLLYALATGLIATLIFFLLP